MEAYENAPTTPVEGPGQKIQQRLQLAELVVDEYTQCLKDPRRGVDSAEAALAPHPCQGCGVSNLAAPVGIEDSHCNPAGLLYLTVPGERTSKLARVQGFQQSPERHTGTGVHSHVERPRRREAEAAARIVELQRAYSKVCEQAVGALPSRLL